MITPQEFKRQWQSMPLVIEHGYTEFVRANPADLKPLNIPEEAKHWLAEVGLPQVMLDIALGSDNLAVAIPPLSKVIKRRSDFDREIDHLYVIAETNDVWYLCVDRWGKLWFVDLNTHQYFFFLNSSLSQLAECLLASYRFHTKYGEELQRQDVSHHYPNLVRIWEEWGDELTQIDQDAMQKNAVWFRNVSQFILG